MRAAATNRGPLLFRICPLSGAAPAETSSLPVASTAADALGITRTCCRPTSAIAEVGRQPWTVHGLLRTADSASAVATAHVGASLALFVLFYCVLLGAWVFYGIRWIAQGPAAEEPPPRVRNVLRDRPMPAVR